MPEPVHRAKGCVNLTNRRTGKHGERLAVAREQPDVPIAAAPASGLVGW